MGDIADMMLEGELCEGCGCALDGESPGYPRYCSKRCRMDRGGAPIASPAKKVQCPSCGKRVKPVGLADHIKASHGSQGGKNA